MMEVMMERTAQDGWRRLVSAAVAGSPSIPAAVRLCRKKEAESFNLGPN